MKKRIFSWLLLWAILAGMVPAVLAAKGPAEEAAQSLYEMGLFRGTGTEADGSPRFDLDRTLTRHEAAVMLVRLLGREQDARQWLASVEHTEGLAEELTAMLREGQA